MMTRTGKRALIIAAVVTLICLVTWQVTGGDYYTKFQVVEEVEAPVDTNDPLAAAGFYEGEASKQTVTHDTFRFGLLPTPQSVLDKHAVSVASISGPFWVLAIGFAWWSRRKERTSH